ncbi:MAG: hypothetical protein ABL967_15925 [Bryobacteraceae bacterium]
MQFRIGKDAYDQDKLRFINAGSQGQVFDLGAGSKAAKIYWDNPTDGQRLKLIQLFDIGRDLDQDEKVGRSAALPLAPAIGLDKDDLVGFSMRNLDGWPELSSLTYDWQARTFKEANGFRYNDQTAFEAVERMFTVIARLARRHIAVGDIKLSNILIDPKTGNPSFIDMDSVNLEGLDSESGGTEGYTDPHLLELDANAEGGLYFDAKSDVFALTVVAFQLLVGIMPHMVPTHPPFNNLNEYAKRGISLIRVLRQGTGFLGGEKLQLASSERIDYLRERLDELKRIRGASGRDGEQLIEHFEDVFIWERRDNLIERLAGEEFDPIETVLIRTGGREAIETIAATFGIPVPQATKPTAPTVALELPRRARRVGPYLAGDPRSLASFAALRGIDIEAMIS